MFSGDGNIWETERLYVAAAAIGPLIISSLLVFFVHLVSRDGIVVFLQFGNSRHLQKLSVGLSSSFTWFVNHGWSTEINAILSIAA